MRIAIIAGVTLLLAAGLAFLFSGSWLTGVILIFLSLVAGVFFIRF